MATSANDAKINCSLVACTSASAKVADVPDGRQDVLALIQLNGADINPVKLPIYVLTCLPADAEFTTSPPVGSLCFAYAVAAGVITKATLYMKTTAGDNWTVIGAVAAL